MVVKRTRTELTFETETLVLLRAPESCRRGFCEACGGQRLLLTVESAAQVTATSPGEIHRLVGIGRLHAAPADAELLVCHQSLLRHLSLQEPWAAPFQKEP